ncbi:MAG: HD domain-containing protein [Nitrospirae bacterium]|nr:HD domain-containing protein [Nitrospirota bacterium]
MTTHNLIHHIPFNGTSLIADPIHQYITFTVPLDGPTQKERTEKDLIDSPWMQRLRSIYQLQSARWVYPAAEHTRFQHSLGAMHLAGRLAKHIYPSLAQTIPDVPSSAYIEEVLRVTALLHDIGHGPFCHFFDHHYLNEFQLTHEHLGQVIIRKKLGGIIQKIRRSPSGPFLSHEKLDPEHIAFLILKDPKKNPKKYPRWLSYLQPIIGGIFTADNFDYVLRDSYMCGVAVGPIDIARLIHYTLITSKGLTIHRNGLPAFQMFLNARMYLYSNVYYHRTTRAIDLHLREIFNASIKEIFPFNPLDEMDQYLKLTDWSLIETVRGWTQARKKKLRQLGEEWEKVLGRTVKWKMAFHAELPIHDQQTSWNALRPEDLESQIRAKLPSSLQNLTFKIDMAIKDPRPLNLLNMGEFQIFVYDPATHTVEKEKLQEFFTFLPAQMVFLRIFSEHHRADKVLARIATKELAILANQPKPM